MGNQFCVGFVVQPTHELKNPFMGTELINKAVPL
jgi:hypothetical protein